MSADPATLWHATAAPGPVFPAASGVIEADLLVVGGGFTGLSTALHAAEAGLRVVVLEAERIAWGATGRNAGFVVPNFAKMDPEAVLSRLGPDRGAALIRFASESADLVFALIRRHAIACDARQTGWIQLAPTVAALERTRARARQWLAFGRPVQTLDAEAATEMTGAKGYKGGWIDHSGGVLNPVGFARGLARAAAGAGAALHENSPVASLVRSGEGWLARTETAQIRVARVVLATNAYATGLVPDLARSYFPLKVFQIATQPLPEHLHRKLLPGGQGAADTRRNLFTFRLDGKNRLISGGMHCLDVAADRRVPRAIHRRMARLLDMPDLPPLAFSWSGTASVMPDFLPALLDLGPGMVAAFACNGRGIAMSTRAGQEVAAWAQGTPLTDLALPSRTAHPIALHALMRHAPKAMLPVSMLRDAWDERNA